MIWDTLYSQLLASEEPATTVQRPGRGGGHSIPYFASTDTRLLFIIIIIIIIIISSSSSSIIIISWISEVNSFFLIEMKCF